MRTINIKIEVTDDEYRMLQMGQADQPNPLRIKQMLLQGARSAVRHFIDTTYQRSVNGRVRTVVWRDLEPDGKGGWLSDSNVRAIHADEMPDGPLAGKRVK